LTVEQLANLGEAIGGIAVVISLIALIYQIRQNTQAIKAQTARDADSCWATINMDMSADTERASLIVRIGPGVSLEDFEPDEQFRLHMWTRGLLQQFQSEYYVWKSGSLPDDVFERSLLWCRGYIDSPVVDQLFGIEIELQMLDPALLKLIKHEAPHVRYRVAGQRV